MDEMRKTCFEQVERVVVKIGSGVLTSAGGLNLGFIDTISRQINGLMQRDIEVILVSSGALAAGIRKVGLRARPHDIPVRQAAAAVGQARLIREYEKAFDRFDRKVAQILLTGNGMTDRRRYLNARNTLNTLLEWKVLPIINENDTVSIEEIKFGDNDNLAAVITLMMDAGMLISLTDIDGLYDRDPRTDPAGTLVSVVEEVDDRILSLADDIPGALGLGGMQSKIRAARKVSSAGVPMVIARGPEKDVLTRLFDAEPLGTFFKPGTERLSSRKRWIGYSLTPLGVVVVDDGAARAIWKGGKSLLPSGVVAVEGEFDMGAPVVVRTAGGNAVATGLVNYSADQIRRIKGLNTRNIRDALGQRPYDEVIHRDNLVLRAGQ
jgi:glutamate 5-kinase